MEVPEHGPQTPTKATFRRDRAAQGPDGGEITGFRARYTGPDLQRHSRVFADKMAAETWLNDERILIDRDEWIPPRERDRQARIAKQRAIDVITESVGQHG